MKPLEERKIGSGDVAAWLGFSPHKGQMAAWNRACGFEDGKTNDAMHIGLELEEPIVRLAMRKMGWHGYRRAVSTLHPEKPYLRATPDWIVDDEFLVETKWCSGWMEHEWFDPTGEMCVPRGYLLQILYQLEVTGYPRAFCASIVQGQVVALPVERDPEMGADIIDLLDRCYRDYVATGTPPVQPDGSDAYSQYLMGRWPRALKPEYLQASEEDEKLMLKLRGYHAAKAEAEKGYKLTAQLLQERIKDAPGIAGKLGKVAWVERAGYVVKAHEVKPTRYLRCGWKDAAKDEAA